MEVLSVVLLAIVVAISLIAFFAVLEVLFPRRVARTRTAMEETGGRAFLVGLINLVFFSAIALAFFALGNWVGVEFLGLVGALALLPLVLGIIFGLGGAVSLVGERLAPDGASLKRTIWGAVALEFACGLPFVGWFALLPYLAILGLGGFILSFFSPRQSASLDVETEII